MKETPTYTATIYAGLLDTGRQTAGAIETVSALCQAYVDDVGLCVTVTPTDFLYTGGREPGVAVGLMNYPRFPAHPEVIRGHALALATGLKAALHQKRVSIVFTDRTVTLEETG